VQRNKVSVTNDIEIMSSFQEVEERKENEKGDLPPVNAYV